jgi:hypothetical protein
MRTLKQLRNAGLAVLLTLAGRATAATVEALPFDSVGIPYAFQTSLGATDSAELPGGHVGAWSWDEDTFPETARGWTHTSAWVKVDLTEPAALTLRLEAAAGVPWPAADNAGRLAGTNLYPSFTLYRGWDTDAGVVTNADGTTLDQDHTFNNRGDIAWAEDVAYVDHVANATERVATRTWLLPAGRYTLNLGGNSPSTLAEGRQGYRATLATTPSEPVPRWAHDGGRLRWIWPRSASGLRLVRATTLGETWSDAEGVPVLRNGRWSQEVDETAPVQFFRLTR